jgi:hypothetical protein
MAIYKIFPTKDATLYSAYPNMNTGIDAILEVSSTNPSISPSPRAARAILDFNENEIVNVINNKIISGSTPTINYKTYLRLYIAEAQGINQDTTLEVRLSSGSWNNGSGQYLDSPQTTNGVSWNYKFSSGSGAWSTPGGDLRSSPGPGYVELTQSFDTRTTKDLNLDVTTATSMIYNNILSMGTDSYLIKLVDSQELISGSENQPEFKFFSVDTNTIYPPQLEFRWDDFSTSSNAPTEITTSDLTIALDENPGIYYSESINRFRLNVRPTYPTRAFQTSSIYTTNHSLPTASYYAIKDLDTDEYVVNFDTSYTKISNDENGSYFDVYMNGLEPERNYKILIQTTVDNSTMVKDEDYIFKVING